VWRVSKEETVRMMRRTWWYVVWVGVACRGGRFGGYQQNKRAAYGAVCWRGFPLLPARVSLSLSLTL